MIENLIPRLLGWVPVSWRRMIIGCPDKPSETATLVHRLINSLPCPESDVTACHGALQGYRMSVDWERFRSFVYGTWEPNVVQAVTSAVKPGMRIVDVGAHIGYYTLLFAKFAGPSGHVVSFEPSVANFALLKKNVELNHLPNVQLFHEAVYSRTGDLTINVPEDVHNSGNASICHLERSKPLQVKAITLDSFCASSNFCPDFLKMDVEGSEYDVLLGGREVIAQSRPKMLVELHHFDGNAALNPVPDLLRKWAYDVQWLDRWDFTSHILASPS
jgi:FkbM family methyltransferase